MSIRIDCGTCVLRPWRASDAPVITPLLGDKDVWINLSDRVPHPYELKHAEEFIERHSKLNPATNVAITEERRDDGRVGRAPWAQDTAATINGEAHSTATITES